MRRMRQRHACHLARLLTLPARRISIPAVRGTVAFGTLLVACLSARAMWRRGRIGWATLSLYCVALVGSPLPQPAAVAVVDSEPFPCEHHGCGCRTADQCRRHCCCFTESEKDAWFAARQVGAKSVGARMAKPKACCSSKHRDSRGRSDEGSHDCNFSYVSAQKCQGLASLWLIIGAALPMPTKWQHSSQPTGTTILPVDESGTSLRSAPPVPPPRIS